MLGSIAGVLSWLSVSTSEAFCSVLKAALGSSTPGVRRVGLHGQPRFLGGPLRGAAASNGTGR